MTEKRNVKYLRNIVKRRFGDKFVDLFISSTFKESLKIPEITAKYLELLKVDTKQDRLIAIRTVKKNMHCWIRHGLYTMFKVYHQPATYFIFNEKNLLEFDRCHVYIYLVKKRLGNCACSILKEIFLYGEMPMACILIRVYQRNLNSSESVEYSVNELCDSFHELLKYHLIQRSPRDLVLEVEPDAFDNIDARLRGAAANKNRPLLKDIPQYAAPTYSDFQLPACDVRSYLSIKLAEIKGKPSEETHVDASGHFSQPPDQNFYYRPCYMGLRNLWRDEIIIDSAAKYLDSPVAIEVLRSLLDYSAAKGSLSNAEESELMDIIQIIRSLPKQFKSLNESELQDNLDFLSDNCKCSYVVPDNARVANRFYCCPYRKVWETLTRDMAHSVLTEKYGSEGLRCYRAVELTMKAPLSKIEMMTVMSSRDVQFALLELVRDGFLLQETFFDPSNTKKTDNSLYRVNDDHLLALLFEYACRAIFNINQRLSEETARNKHLLDKESTMNSLLALMDNHIATNDLTDEEREEFMSQRSTVEQRLSHGERLQLEKYRKGFAKLQMGKMESIKALFIADYYR